MKLSARNQIAGKVKSINKGPVSAIVEVEVASGIIITANISSEAVDELGLAVGKPATAVIKATAVMIAA